MANVTVGVLALQGGFAEHLALLAKFPGVTPVDVRDTDALATCSALIIPGGESTVIRLVAERYALLPALREFASSKPVWGVCAGMICLANHLERDSVAFTSRDQGSEPDEGLVGGLSVTVARNYFGNQSRSAFRRMTLNADAAGTAGLCDRSHFIRAPAVSGAVPEAVTVLARVGDVVVAVRQGHLLGTAFHPEVSQDPSWTAYFLNEIVSPGGAFACDPLPAMGPHFIPDGVALQQALEAGDVYGSVSVKRAMPRFLQGGVIMDVVNAEQARVAEAAGACSVMALERIPADIKKDGGIARMSDPELIQGIQAVVSIPVMAKARIGHFAEAQVLQALDVDCIDESEVLTPADEVHHIRKEQFAVPFVCGAKNLGEALRRIAEGAALIRLKGNAGTGNVMHAVRHARLVFGEIRQLQSLDEDEVYVFAKEHQSPLELVRLTRALGRLPVTTFAAGGIATPADVMLLMSMGCDGVFVGSGIFKGSNSPQRARAMVEACTYWRRPEVVAKVSAGLGKAMVGILDNGETYNYVKDSAL